MKPINVFTVVGLAIAFAAPSASAQHAERFAACVATTGKEYEQARDAYLNTPATDGDFLVQKRRQGQTPTERLTATILQGWRRHEKEYRPLLAADRVVDRSGRAHFVWARGGEGLTADAAPLMYELMTKEIIPGAETDAAFALAGLAQTNPDTPLDVQALHRYLREVESASQDSRRAVASLLSALPPEKHWRRRPPTPRSAGRWRP
jgi:hypothetical protein